MPYNHRKVYYIEGEWGGRECICCGWFRGWKEFGKNRTAFKGRENTCRICRSRISRKDSDKLSAYHKNYYREHKDEKKEASRKRYICKKEEITTYKKERSVSPAKYKTFGKRLTVEESPRKTKNGYVKVRCANSSCRKYFIPTVGQVSDRIKALNGQTNGELRLYCSEKCKQECSLYGQIKYPKGFKTKPTGTEFPKYVKEKILERDNYKCQICGETHRLQAHHIYPGSTHPMLSNDVDNGITLCKKCHKKVHKLPGCGLHEIAACSQRIKQDLDDKGIDPHEIPDWAVEKYMETSSNNIQEV